MREPVIFYFRNDDVRKSLDPSLVEITELFIRHRIPISHAVEPANISKPVIQWLSDIKQRYPDLVEIMQHGYDHRVKNQVKKGEFGGQRNYQEQFSDILNGKNMMDEYFGTLWFPAFNFPYGTYNLASMKAVKDAGFKVVNGSYNLDWTRQVFYFAAHLLKKEYFLNIRVPYHLSYRPVSGLFELDMSISLIDKYLDEMDACDFLSLEELKAECIRYSRLKYVGILVHHRYHNTNEKINLIEQLLIWLKSIEYYGFRTQEQIFKSFSQ